MNFDENFEKSLKDFDRVILNGTLLLRSIEIGLEQAPFVVFVNFFPHLNM
jgi:hypothetical protein